MSDREAQVILTANNTQYNKSVEDSQKATDKLNKALEKTSETATKITKATAKGLLKIGASEVAGLTALSAVAATLEKQTSNIQSNLALNKSASQYNAVTASIRQMSRELPMARAEVAQMATAVSDLGMISAKQIGGVSKTFNKMGLVTGESSVGLANSMVQFQRAMGVAQPTYQTMDPYANSVTGLSARAGTSAQGIMEFAQSFAPAARVAGMSQSSVLGLSTAATRAGIDGQYAASTISQILNDITALRYTNSPELGRYSRALGMDSSELTRKTAGPEDQDKFMRNVMSKVVAVAQSEEGPSRLSMIGYDGLRARKALQGLASEPGGIEKWIRTAQYEMTQPTIQTGFEASRKGLADQTEMLRNRATDVGQQLGAPTADALAKLAEGANAAAGALQPFTNAVTGFIAKIGIPLGALTMAAGAMYSMWSTFSKVNLASRGLVNVGTSAFAGAVQDARGIASGAINGNAASLSPMGQRLSDPNARTTATQRTMYRIGGAVGSATSGWERPTGVGQMFLQGADRSRQWLQRSTLDWYEKGRLGVEDRYPARLQQEALTDRYKAQRAALGSAASIYPVGYQPQIPIDPRTGRPLAYVPPTGGRYTVGGVMKGMGEAYVKIPGEAALTSGTLLGRGIRGVGSHFVAQPWQEMRANQAEMGMGPWAGQKLSGARAGISSAATGIAGNSMVQFAALMAGMQVMLSERDKYNQWSDKFGKEGTGLSDFELDNLSEYNEKLGLATRSLTQFKKGLDESNPARSDNINSELMNNANVREYGKDMKSLVNERLATIKSVDQAKEWIASQGTMNADQWVMVMRDFSKVFKGNTAAFEELNQWVINNQKSGRVPVEKLPETQELGNMYNEAVGDRSIPRRLFSLATAGSPIVNWLTGGDKEGVRSDKKVQDALAVVVGSQAARANTIGDTKDASKIFGGKPTADQQEILSRAEGLSLVMEKITADQAEINKMRGPFESLDKKNAVKGLEQYVKAASDEFGVDFNKALNFGWSKSVPMAGYDTGKDMEAIKKVLTEQAKYDEDIKAIIDSGLLDEVLSGTSLSKNLPDLTVLSSSRQAVKGTAFESVGEEVFNKYLGEGSLLGQGLLAAGKLSDTTNFAAASKQLLEFAKRVDSDRQSQRAAGAARGDTSSLWSIAGQSSNESNRTYGLLEQMKINNQEGTQGWELAKAAQAEVMRQKSHENVGMNALEQQKDTLSLVTKELLPQLNADPTKQSQDLMPQLGAAKQKASDDQLALKQSILAWGKSREREERDWNISIQRNEDSFYLQRRYSNEDFQRSMKRSRDAFNRSFANSEAGFYRSLKYQSQDFYRGRQREEEAYQRQKKYAAEDTAKNIGDPYNRLQLQMISNPKAMQITMQNRLNIATKQNENIDTLKNRGLSQEAINQMGLSDFGNAQQTQHLANTATDADIAKFNDLVANLTKQGGSLNEEDSSVIRAEKERNIALTNGLDDFLRNLKRTKIEHAIQVKFNKKEFEISVKDATKDHAISLKRSADAYDLMMKNAAADREKNLKDQVEDLFGFSQSGLDNMDKVMKKILGPKGYLALYAGDLGDEIKGVLTTTQAIIDEIGKEIDKLGKQREALETEGQTPNQASETKRENRRATAAAQGATGAAGRALADKSNTPNHCLGQVSEWLGVKGVKSVPTAIAAWRESKDKHPGSKKAPIGKPVYWAGGYGHVALSLGGEKVRTTDWPSTGRVGTTTIDNLTKAWGKQYLGWAGDAWGIKLKDGAILPAKSGGHKAIMAEAGSAEMAIPLNNRGIDFMSTFTKGVAKEMVKSMPRTPVSAQNISNTYDHSQTVSISGMVVESNDPRKFVKELQKEAQKKRAALYKS